MCLASMSTVAVASRSVIQAIVIADRQYARYRRSVDFVQRHIFPGGCLPSPGAICRSLGRATDLQVFHLEDITAHYAETLAHWRQRFRANLEHVRRLGFPEEFIRDLASRVRALIMPEINLGQMVLELERCAGGRCPVRLVGHAGGAIIRPGAILNVIDAVVKEAV